MRFITALELSQSLKDARSPLAQGAEAAAAEAERYFTTERCRSNDQTALICGYYYTHRLLFATHLMTQSPAEVDAATVKDYAGRLRELTIPLLEERKRMRADGNHEDLASEVAFTLKAIAGASDSDPDVARVVHLLHKAGPPQSRLPRRRDVLLRHRPCSV